MKAILTALLAVSIVFGACILGTAVGAFAGWTVGLVFDDSMKLMAEMFGIPKAEPYQLGAILGFIGGFFRSTLST